MRRDVWRIRAGFLLLVLGATVWASSPASAHERPVWREFRPAYLADHPPALRLWPAESAVVLKGDLSALWEEWAAASQRRAERARTAFRLALKAYLEWQASQPPPVAPGPPGDEDPPSWGAEADWYATAVCESGHNPPLWSINTLNPFWGGLQFLPSTWFAYGGGPFEDTGTNPFPYSAAEQIAVAERVLAGQGPGAWPNCFQWKR